VDGVAGSFFVFAAFAGAFWLALIILAVYFLVIFPIWMLIHAGILTAKQWPENAVRNLVFLLVIFFTDVIGATIYYLAVYREARPLDHK